MFDKVIDLTQYPKYKEPHIRVWCHPHYVGKNGDDYCQEFETLKEARKFVRKHKEAERLVLIAYMGYETTVPHFRKLYPKMKIR